MAGTQDGDTGSITEGAPVRSLLEARCATLARRHGVPGAQLAIHDHGTTVTVEVGEAEHRSGPAVTAATAFPVGSITKAFTATAAMVLVADGDLDLDASIDEHLRDLDGLEHEVTLRQLLSHTAGLPAGPDSDEVRTTSTRRYLADHCRRSHLVRPPGTAFSYSNAGYIVVGALIEEITGMPWPEAVTALVLHPLGIAPAFVPGPNSRAVATGHATQRATNRPRPVVQALAPVEAPAGALAVSATDLMRFGVAHLNPTAGLSVMHEPEPTAEPFGLADGWGLGFAHFRDGADWTGHDGNGYGTACYLRIDPKGQRVVAFTSNATTGAAMWRDLCGQLGRLGLPIGLATDPTINLPPAPPVRGCVGSYANGPVEYTVDLRDGRLVLSVDDEPPVRLTLHDGLVFSVPEPETRRPVLGGRFLTAPGSDRVDAVQIGGRLARRTRTVRDTRSSQIA